MPDAAITPRRILLPLQPHLVPVHWFGDNAEASLRVSSLFMLFPEGERFFVRSVRHHLPALTDPRLGERVRDFMAQEAQHGHTHGQANDLLRAHGFAPEAWERRYEHVVRERIERHLPPLLRLAMTAALEHLTASLGHLVLTTPAFQRAHPTMRDLLEWHAAEEIEHKAVAFDVLTAAGGGWFTRAVGMVLALVFFLWAWGSAWRLLADQDPALTRERLARDTAQARQWGIQDARGEVARFALAWFRPGFHPDEVDDRALAADVLERLRARRRFADTPRLAAV